MNSLREALRSVLQRLPVAKPAAVAVSGGLDSWVLALLLREMGRPVAGYTLVSGVAGYCEYAQTLQLARQFDVPLDPIPVEEGGFEAALPRFLQITRTPIYNLHPVSKLLLAEGLAARGVTAIISGDAADQVFRCESECDLLPLTTVCFAHAGVTLHTPFLSADVRALCTAPDPDKQALRHIAAQLGIPPIPKRPTYYPGARILAQTTEMLCAASLA